MDNTNNNDNVILNIRQNFPNFDEEELLEYTKSIIPNIHYFFSYGNDIKLEKYCSKEFIEKVKDNDSLYRISTNIDTVRVGYVSLREYIEKDNKYYIKVYASVFFYDDIDNNKNNVDGYDKYWNDIWIMTYEVKDNREISNKCPSCGALMEFNVSKHMFTCNYCRNSLYYSKINWNVVDISVNEINYK